MKKMGWQVRQAPRTVIVCDIKQDEYIEETIKAILSFAEIKNVREQIFIRYKDMFCCEIEK